MSRERQSKVPTTREILNFKDIHEAIDLAMVFCEKMKLNHSHWIGVPPKEDRIEQARKSLKKLRGFYTDIVTMNTRNWERFRDTLTKGELSSLSTDEMSEKVTSILEKSDVSRAIWISAAKVELPAFLRYLNTLKISYKSWTEIVNSDFNALRISVIVSGFLSQHVGEGEGKVERISQRGFHISTGFDGDEKSCPISIAPGRGIVFFAYMCAEYVLMNAIAEQFANHKNSRNEKN